MEHLKVKNTIKWKNNTWAQEQSGRIREKNSEESEDRRVYSSEYSRQHAKISNTSPQESVKRLDKIWCSNSLVIGVPRNIKRGWKNMQINNR